MDRDTTGLNGCALGAGRTVAAWRVVLGLALGLNLVAARPAAAQVERWVEFRDGTLLHLTLPDDHAVGFMAARPAMQGVVNGEADGGEPVALPLGDVDEITFASTPDGEELARILGLVAALREPDFGTRRQAHAELLKSGGRYCGLLEEALQDELIDPETNARLRAILTALQLPVGADEPYDRLLTKDGRILYGVATGVGPAGGVGAAGTTQPDPPADDAPPTWSAVGRYRGADVLLDRARVRRISADAPSRPAALTGPPHTERISEDDPKAFPGRVIRNDFETDPAGNALHVGQDVGRLFLPRGFLLSTSFPGAIVSVNDYEVEGRSEGKSCATHDPLWKGTLTVRFRAAGDERAPAGVTHVGFWVADVSPGGTRVLAYDAEGRLLANLPTTGSSSDFLGVRSEVPIARVEIMAVEGIDENYTIDDLVFDPPTPLPEAADAERFKVLLHTGERVVCTRVNKEGGELVLTGLAAGGPDPIRLPVADVAKVLAPSSQPAGPAAGVDAPPADDFFAMTPDGSILRVAVDEAWSIIPVRLPKALFEPQAPAAVWGRQVPYVEPPKGADRPEGTALVLDVREPRVIEDWVFRPNRVELLSGEGITRHRYDLMPTVWLAPVPRRDPAASVLRLTTGEELVLGEGGGGFRLESFSPEGVVLRRGERDLSIPLAEVVSLTLPGRQQQEE